MTDGPLSDRERAMLAQIVMDSEASRTQSERLHTEAEELAVIPHWAGGGRSRTKAALPCI